MTKAGSPSPEHPTASVIIPCRGHAEVLSACLEALTGQRPPGPHEVIVVDSGRDPAVAAAVEEFPDVRLVRGELHLEPGAARNLGAAHARGRILAFTDADCEAAAGWLGAACSALDQGARLVGGPVLDARPRHPISVADNLLQFAEFRCGRPGGHATHFPGCNLAIRHADFGLLGRFPEKGLGEDIEFCRRAVEREPEGLVFVPEMVVRHLGRTGFRAMLVHHHTFGLWRGRLQLRIGKLQARLGVFRSTIPLFALWRFLFILRRTAAWNPRGLPAFVLLSPLLLAGLVAWAIGFRRGLLLARPSA